MSPSELFDAFQARNEYYRFIARQLGQYAQMVRPKARAYTDLLARNGYMTRAFGTLDRTVTLVEHRGPFVEGMRANFPGKSVFIHRKDFLTNPAEALTGVRKADIVFCCEQASLLQPNFRASVAAIARSGFRGQPPLLAMTFGPSHHHFEKFIVADYRSGAVRLGEVMSELSHPIRQATERNLVRIANRKHGFTRGNAWPPEAKGFGLTETKRALKEAGFKHLEIIEGLFPVSGEDIYLYDQNGWTFYMRWPPLSDLSDDAKIALLTEAIEEVRALQEYDEWCTITAYHPVAYYLAW
jgi:hypothetical protein